MNSSEPALVGQTRFRKRQRLLSGTPAQCAFDVLFGIIAPFLCLFFDPIVFTGHGTMGSGFLSSFRLLGYAEIALSAMALAHYLLTRRGSPLLAGILLGGFGFAFTLGLMMLPLTIIGLFVGIGFFGLTPFVTSYVFLRNGRRCWEGCPIQRSRRWRLLLLALGAVLILGVPLGLQWSGSYLTNRAVQSLTSGSEQEYARAVATLRLARWILNPDEIVFRYQKASDDKDRDRLARAFQSVTGRSIERRVAELYD
jgi:hypothetical protein